MINRFLELMAEATARIPGHYFQLPVVGKEDPIYRERVYSYELYHQLRTLLQAEDRLAHYALSGEIDKGKHPIIRRCAPDLVLHDPGRMDNLVVVEVKPINAALDGIGKDLDSLAYFVSPDVHYQLGVELVYGDDDSAFSRFLDVFREPGIPRLQLYWHRRVGDRAERVL
jgi:hypothetical protein